MELKDFVKETLMQITQGIKEAQEGTLSFGAVINPNNYDSNADYNYALIKNKRYPVQEVDFEVALNASTDEGNKTGIGVAFGTFALGGQKDMKENNTSSTNVKFTIPVIFPVIDGENNMVDRIVAITPRNSKKL